MKKLVYFLPAIPFSMLLVYFAFLTSIDTTPVVWTIEILLILSGLLLCKNKWWGCFFGVVVGVILIYMGLQESGQIFKEYLIGFPLIIFYVVCGIYVNNKSRR